MIVLEAIRDFDFDGHRAKAIIDYQRIRPVFVGCADAVKTIILQSLDTKSIKIASVEARAKSLESFAEKATLPSEADTNRPKYLNPISEITDLSGVRVITFFPATVSEVEQVVNEQFDILERINKTDALIRNDRLGYQSIHFLVRLKSNRSALPEYSQFRECKTEIQIRTILQHAWAEIEHDIQYKSEETIPAPIRRRFMALAGLIEIADREFQAIQNDDTRFRTEARQQVEQGKFENINITGDALKAYLDRRLGPDGRMSLSSYDWEAKNLIGLGFFDLKEVDDCVGDIDHVLLGRKVTGGRPGQLSRFELVLMMRFGERYLEMHQFSKLDWWKNWKSGELDRIKAAGYQVGLYNRPESTQR